MATMADERKRDSARQEDLPEDERQKAKDKPTLPDTRAKLGDTMEGEGSPGLSIGGGGHA
jgi:hypothetical protein